MTILEFSTTLDIIDYTFWCVSRLSAIIHLSDSALPVLLNIALNHSFIILNVKIVSMKATGDSLCELSSIGRPHRGTYIEAASDGRVIKVEI